MAASPAASRSGSRRRPFSGVLPAWVGNKQDTTRLGLATLALSAIALLAAVTWLRRQDPSVGTRLLVAAGLAGGELRADARDVVATIGRSWLDVLTVVLGAFYIFLGATAVGLAGALGIVGGLVVVALIATAGRISLRVAQSVLVVAALPFALLTWWSIVTPLLAMLVTAIGSLALRANRGPIA